MSCHLIIKFVCNMHHDECTWQTCSCLFFINIKMYFFGEILFIYCFHCYLLVLFHFMVGSLCDTYIIYNHFGMIFETYFNYQIFSSIILEHDMIIDQPNHPTHINDLKRTYCLMWLYGEPQIIYSFTFGKYIDPSHISCSQPSRHKSTQN